MRKRDVTKLKVGDTIRLKHNLGGGTIVEIVHTERDGLPGRYPMIRFKATASGKVWCTHRVIDTYTLRSKT